MLVRESVFLLAVLTLAACGDGPTKPKDFILNPNLRLLTGGVPLQGMEEKFLESAEFPVWSPDGSKIYFLNVIGNWQEGSTDPGKEIRMIDAEGGPSTVLFADNYMFLSISPDGSKFLTTIEEPPFPGYHGGQLAMLDIASRSVDTLPIPDSLRASSAEFTPSGDSIIFFATFVDTINQSPRLPPYWGGYFLFDLSTRTTKFMYDQEPFLVSGLAVTPDGQNFISVGKMWRTDGSGMTELSNVGIWPSLSPSGDTVLSAVGFSPLKGPTVNLTDLPRDSGIADLVLLQEGAFYSEFRFSPDGTRIALVATFQLPQPGKERIEPVFVFRMPAGLFFFGRSAIYVLDEL